MLLGGRHAQATNAFQIPKGIGERVGGRRSAPPMNTRARCDRLQLNPKRYQWYHYATLASSDCGPQARRQRPRMRRDL